MEGLKVCNNSDSTKSEKHEVQCKSFAPLFFNVFSQLADESSVTQSSGRGRPSLSKFPLHLIIPRAKSSVHLVKPSLNSREGFKIGHGTAGQHSSNATPDRTDEVH